MKKACVFFLCALLSTCGFHLRGSFHLPQSARPIYVTSNKGHFPLERLIKNKLSLQGVDITDDPVKAKYRIMILNEHMRQDIAAVAASTVPRQFQLTLQVVYKIQKKSGDIFLPAEPLTVSIDRLLTLNNNRILGSDNEASILKHEMQTDVAAQILVRLEHFVYFNLYLK